MIARRFPVHDQSNIHEISRRDAVTQLRSGYDLGWSDVGWHNGFAKTPNLDRLVKEGVELDQHYVQPVCMPTRTALMSGRYPGRFGPQALAPSNLRAMPLGTVTMASMLKSLGYGTYQSGKWHLRAKNEWGPTHFGFDHGYGTLTGSADPWTHKYRPRVYEETWHREVSRRSGKTGFATANGSDEFTARCPRSLISSVTSHRLIFNGTESISGPF